MTDRRLGRPRDERVDEALASAVRELLTNNGYQEITVDAIAVRAGVGKPAIYRRYRSKAELVFSVMVHGLSESAPPDSGSLRADLTTLLQRVHGMLATPLISSAFPGLLVDMRADSALTERFRDTLIRAQRDAVAEICGRAVARGELAALPDVDQLHAMILGPLLVRIIVLGERIGESELKAQVAALMGALGVR